MEVIYRCPDEAGVTVPGGVLLPEFALENASRWPDRRAFVDGVTGRTLTYAQVGELVYNVAAGVADLGIRPGESILLLLPNLPEYAVLFLGIIAAGAVVTTANPAYSARELAHQMVDSEARMVITSPELLDKVHHVKTGKSIVFVVFDSSSCSTASSTASSSRANPSESTSVPPGTIGINRLFRANGAQIRARRRPQQQPHSPTEPAAAEAAALQLDTCALPYSSGTTGVSKGVMLSHRNLIANIQQLLAGSNPRLDLSPEDTVLGLLPMFHIYAITLVNLLSLRAGACVVTLPRFDLLQYLRTLQEYQVSVAPIVPPIILAMAKLPVVDAFDLAALRRVVSGAAPLGPELEAAFRAKFPTVQLGQGYGMTEASPTVSASRLFARVPQPPAPGSCGSVLPLTEVKVVDTSTGESLLPNKRGELWVRGPQVMTGYLNNPEATAATITPDGWLRTGDVAYVDERGEIFVVDRVKELIKVKGFQVPPAELEGLLISHPDIADAAVVPAPSEESGEVPVAFVVLQQGGAQLSVGEVKDFISKQVATYKRLHDVRFVDAIPKTASGKVLRKDLKARL
ncbi:hypothetical protein CLOM_g9891 [Closterium sp. NIES-68]|nr:hypothetical protein CLOM_g9891 [Closterium sp. NIES-68]GJP75916.1 hypothetical protein CLOP_g6316 [Closterium sp. NIES-67]